MLPRRGGWRWTDGIVEILMGDGGTGSWEVKIGLWEWGVAYSPAHTLKFWAVELGRRDRKSVV